MLLERSQLTMPFNLILLPLIGYMYPQKQDKEDHGC